MKILLIADKINNELVFIKNLRELTGKPISEIRECIRNQKPFFEGILDGRSADLDNEDGDNEVLVTKILSFINRNGDKIRLFLVDDDEEFEALDDLDDEITQEHFENMLESDRETSKYLDEIDELRLIIETCDQWMQLTESLMSQSENICKKGAHLFLENYDETQFDDFDDLSNSKSKVLLSQIYDKLNLFECTGPFMNNPKWLEVVDLAGKAYLDLEYQIINANRPVD